MDETCIPIVGMLAGHAMVVAIVAMASYRRTDQVKMRVDTEIRKMDLAYQRAKESLSRSGGAVPQR
jgi:hypothetical protein